MTAGKVYLVGAGPGDPGLITVKGLEMLRAADVVVYDRLVNEALLDEAGPEVELVFAGASLRRNPNRQADINAMLVRFAEAGKRVVRLKGGDPFVFGRGGEEAEALAAHGVEFEVVPGITSAIAAPAYAGIPVTDRRASSSFAVITGREDAGREWSRVAWAKLAGGAGTLVILMSVETLESALAQLREHGVPASTPAAVIEWGSLPRQRSVEGTLGDIAARVAQAGLGPPSVTVVGDVVRLRSRIGWFENKPLFGMRVMVTRAKAQARPLSQRLMSEGAEPIKAPTIEIRPAPDVRAVDDAIGRVGSFDAVIFTSVNAVDAFFVRLGALGLDARALGGLTVAAVGLATAAALERRGVRADFTPRRYTTAALAEAMPGLEGKRVLLPRSAIAPTELLEWLAARGVRVEQVHVYDTVTPKETPARARELLENRRVDVVTFTSSSTVDNLVGALGGDAGRLLEGLTLASIGPVTTRTAEARGLRVAVTAEEHTVDGLVDALKVFVQARTSTARA